MFTYKFAVFISTILIISEWFGDIYRVCSRQINNEIGVHIHLKALITVSQIKHAFPWVSQVEVWATFCFLYFQLKHDLGCGWWPLPATSLSTQPV